MTTAAPPDSGPGANRGHFAAELLGVLQPLSAALGHPRVQALHLPPAQVVPDSEDPQRGEFAALQIEGGALGLSYVLLGNTLQHLRQLQRSGSLVGLPALELAQGLLHLGPEQQGPRALAWAAAQALGQALMLQAGWQPPEAGDPFAGLAPGPGDHIGLVGLFGPLMKRLTATGARITVLELRADWVGAHEGYEVTLEPRALQACNKVLATGTLLLNNSIDAVLAHTRQAAQVALIGPSVSTVPEPLFARGVQVVGGTWIHDRSRFVQALLSGQERRDCARKYTLSAQQWPGFRQLLPRGTAR